MAAACAEAFLGGGAAVCGLDIDGRVAELVHSSEYLGLRCDVTSPSELRHASRRSAREFGGLDILVLCAGVFPASQPVATLDAETWRSTFSINLDANLELMRLAHPWLAQAPGGGRVLIIGSKSGAHDPGRDAPQRIRGVEGRSDATGAYHALEWGNDGIRVNVRTPECRVRHGIWSEDVIGSGPTNTESRWTSTAATTC